jgi:sulfotransferase family protein
MTDQNPIFIFSSSWRSGSTLLQRFITSSGEILIWGETGGALNAIANAIAGWEQITANSTHRFSDATGGGGEAAYYKFIAATKSEHPNQWIANLSPPYSDILASFRDMFDGLYRQRALTLGYQRYGFKETRCDLDTAHHLRALFPDARFVFLVRNPISVILSIKRRRWMARQPGHKTLKYFAEHWRTRAIQFRQADFGLVLRYEDFVADPTLQEKLIDHLGMTVSPPRDFVDRSQIDWEANDSSELSLWERARLQYWLGDEMKHWGY